MDDKKLTIPYAPLFYWSKYWLSYHRTHPEWDIVEQAKDVVLKCDSFASTHDPEMRLLFMFEHIVEWLKEYNASHPDNKQNISRCMDSIWSFEYEVRRMMQIYNCSHQEAMIRLIRSEVGMIYTGKMGAVCPPLTYDKRCGFTIGTWKPGMTYKTQQKMFNKQHRIEK